MQLGIVLLLPGQVIFSIHVLIRCFTPSASALSLSGRCDFLDLLTGNRGKNLPCPVLSCVSHLLVFILRYISRPPIISSTSLT